jgi:riboflavin biosynthesis pyrimidine reductase
VDIDELMAQLAARGMRRVLCEGGPSWLGELVVAGQVDELCLTIAPMMGGDPLPVAVFPPGAPLTGFTLEHVLREDDTLFLRYERSL